MSRYSGLSRAKLFDEQKRLNRNNEMTPEVYLEIDNAFRATEADWSALHIADASKQRLLREAALDSAFIKRVNELRNAATDMPQKMAGEDWSQALTDNDVKDFLIELQGQGSATAELPQAYERLMNKTNEYARLNRQLNNAGINTPDAIQELNTGVLTSGSPGPVINRGRGTETRQFLDWEDNAVTGAMERVPFLDPKDSSKALSITFGDTAEQRDLASEVVQAKILALMGGNPSQYAGRNGMGNGAADFQATIDGKRLNIDGQIRDITGPMASTANIPAYMNIRPQGFIPAGYQGDQRAKNEIENQIKPLLDKGYDIESAVEELGRRGIITGPSYEAQRIGKILRNDKSKVDPGYHYDKLMMTGYDNTDNVIGQRDAGGVISAPSTAHLVDLERARTILNAATGKTAKERLMVTPNKNKPEFLKNQAKNMKVQSRFKIDDSVKGEPVFEDVVTSTKYPLVSQIMRDLQYK